MSAGAGARLGLVLAGGGVAGIAWELGVLRGVADVDAGLAARLVAADVVVGTSAGSTVATQITSGTPLPELYDAQLSPTNAEIEVDVDLPALLARMAEAMVGATSDADARRRVGAVALASETVEPAVRRTAVAARLSTTTWPDRTLLVPTVDADTGELLVLDRDSGVGLLDAVTASCAVPGVWPPVAAGGRRLIDGGVRSTTNADLARDCEAVVVLTPSAHDADQTWGDVTAEIDTLAPTLTPDRAHVVHADGTSLAAFGTNALSPATRSASARAGREVGRREAPAIAAALGRAVSG